MTVTMTGAPVVDARARGWLEVAQPVAREAWRACQSVAGAEVGEMGLAAGDRPLADVEVLAGAVGMCEYALAVRMQAASAAGALPLTAPGEVLRARGWSAGQSRRLARCAALVARCPALGTPWAAGMVTSEHLDPIARLAERFIDEELAAIAEQLAEHWGTWPPGLIGRFVQAADRMLHPPPDPTPHEVGGHAARSLSFSLTRDSVILAGELPRLEGELVIAAIDALAQRLRSEADHVPAAARRADALVQLVNDAHAAGGLPTHGGLPVALTVTLALTACGDPVWTTSRGHLLTGAEARWACCDAEVSPVLVESPPSSDRVVLHPSDPSPAACAGAERPGPADRIAALAAALCGTRIPLDVGRTARTATPAQRRALAVRDRGCAIPGCGVPAEACQVHHLHEWADGGATDLANCVLLCWSHHRQVDLRMWTIRPAGPQHLPTPPAGAPPGTPWPANHGAPFVVTRAPRHRWRD